MSVCVSWHLTPLNIGPPIVTVIWMWISTIYSYFYQSLLQHIVESILIFPTTAIPYQNHFLLIFPTTAPPYQNPFLFHMIIYMIKMWLAITGLSFWYVIESFCVYISMDHFNLTHSPPMTEISIILKFFNSINEGDFHHRLF